MNKSNMVLCLERKAASDMEKHIAKQEARKQKKIIFKGVRNGTWRELQNYRGQHTCTLLLTILSYVAVLGCSSISLKAKWPRYGGSH